MIHYYRVPLNEIETETIRFFLLTDSRAIEIS